MTNNCAIKQKKNLYPDRDVMGRDYVVCPKPRRAGLSNSSFRCAGWQISNQAEVYESKAGNELLDIILSKGGGHDTEQAYTHLASSPPFFCGSPPSRVSNPLIQDARFVEVKQQASLQHPNLPIVNSSPSSSTRKNGLVRAKFGNNPAVRVEGFEALDRDGRNCSIPALA